MGQIKIGILSDLHGGDATDGTEYNAGTITQDGSMRRTHSQWEYKLEEFAQDCYRHNVERVAFTGDLIDRTDGNIAVNIAAIFAKIKALFNDKGIYALPAMGNHDHQAMTVNAWCTAMKNAFGMNNLAPVGYVGDPWPGTVKASEFCAYRDTSHSVFDSLVLWGYAGPAVGDEDAQTYCWTGAFPDAGAVYDAGVSNTAPGCGAGGWLQTMAPAKPLLVFCHQHLNDQDGAGYIPLAKCAAIRADIEAYAVNTHVFTGHYHRVSSTNNTNLHLYESTTANSITYHELPAATLGKSSDDIKSNNYSIWTIDETAGVTEMLYYDYLPLRGRERYKKMLYGKRFVRR